MKEILQVVKILLVSCLVTSLHGQLVEIPLDSANVFGGPKWYNFPTGNQTIPGAQVNDTFSYDPNDPMSAYPNQAWAIYPEYSYYFMRPEPVPEKAYNDPAFPEIDVDSNFLAVNFEIPEGKTIRYLDVWGQNAGSHQNRGKNLVIILKNGNTQWEYVGWEGASNFTSDDQGFGRFDFAENGVTDNLLKTANLLVITRFDRRFDEVRLAEFRLAGEDDPYAGDVIPPVLSNYTSGEIFYDFIVKGQCNEKGTVYIVPKGTYTSIKEIQDTAIHKLYCLPNTEFNVTLENVPAGEYAMIALDGGDNLSTMTDDIAFMERPLSTDASITTVEILNAKTISDTLDSENKIVNILLDKKADISKLFTVIEVAKDAVIDFESYTYVDFTNPVQVEVVAEDGETTLNWTINVKADKVQTNGVKIRNENELASVYPTMVIDQLKIKTNLTEFEVKIYNVNGKLVKISRNNTTVNVQDLNAGFYITHISSKGEVVTDKFIIQSR